MNTSIKPLHRRALSSVVYRSRSLRGWLKHSVARSLRPYRRPPAEELRLHVGSGTQRLEGWVNVDLRKLPEVDVALDVRDGLPFRDVDKVYAEHFLEHLDVDVAVDFLLDVRTILRPGGWLRLSTPNLDWVWRHVYLGEHQDDAPRILQAIRLNRAFYGWQHRFLWNRPLLGKALTACGFQNLRWCRYGESELEAFRGIERHETYPDTEETPHVLIVEAARGRPDREAVAALKEELHHRFLKLRYF